MTAEYAIIVARVAVCSIAVITLFGDQIRALFGANAQQISGNANAQVAPLTDVSQQTQGHRIGNF
jgi:Flp pilus assembly pilin Flp